MPVHQEKIGDKYRVVDPDGSIALNQAGTAVDGGGHGKKEDAVAQVQAININMRKSSIIDDKLRSGGYKNVNRIAKLMEMAGILNNLKIACLREAASLKEAERAMRPVMEKTINSLQNRFKRDGVDSVKLIKVLPAQQAATTNSYYQIAWYGLMTKENPSGRCGTIQLTTTFNNEPDEQDLSISLKIKLGDEKQVMFPSASPVGVVTKVLNYVTKLEQAGKNFSYWAKSYKPSNPTSQSAEKPVIVH